VTAVGLLLPTRARVVDGRPEVEPILALAERAERAGLDSVWVSESPLVRARHDAPSVLAAVAARTSNIAVGSAVLLAPLRHPLLLLHQAATIDQISGGRFVLGLGAGFPMPQTHQQLADLQIDHRTRRDRLHDAVRLAAHVWRQPAASRFEGKTMSVEAPVIEPGPHRSGGPPIWLAGSGPSALRAAGELADGWLPYPPTPEQYAEELAVVRQHAAAAGRPPPVAGLYATLAIHPDASTAERLADAHLQRCYDLPAELVRQVQACFAGPYDDAIRWLRAYCEAGAEHLVIRVAGPVDEQVVGWLASLRRALGRGPHPDAPARRPLVPAGASSPTEERL